MKESTSSDSFSDAMNNMLNEGDIPSFMKKIMGKEKERNPWQLQKKWMLLSKRRKS